nr:hypothetical protein [uncultured Bacillus sp.]
MQVQVVLNGYHIIKTRDRIGGTLITNLFELENGVFQAFSHYSQDKDEEFTGFSESCNTKEAIRLSRRDLRKKWVEER